MKASPLLHAFNAGELSPLLLGRTDLKYYANGCRRIRNFIPTKQGAARRRPGTRFVRAVKDSAAQTWLWRFEFNVEQSYVMEFGDKYIRFFSNHALVEDPPGTPYEVVTPYLLADLTTSDGFFALKFAQFGETIYIVHPDYPTQKLVRSGAASFTLSEVEFLGGPFEPLVDSAASGGTTFKVSARTGAGVTLTASAATFDASVVGMLFYLELDDAISIAAWEPGKLVAINDLRRSDGKTYKALNAGTTGTIKPTHSRGAIFDGNASVQWEFQDPGYGWCVITGFTDDTHVTVTVLSDFPADVVAPKTTTRWARGQFGGGEGYPDRISFFRERLVLMQDRTLFASVVGDFENFSSKDDGGVVTAEMAITIDIVTDRSNSPQWLAPSDIALLVGTAGDEIAISELSESQSFGPGNVRARKQTEYGSRPINPLRVGEGLLLVQKSGRKTRDLQFSFDKSGYIAPDLTILSEHLTKGGIVDGAFQQEPDSNAWFVRDDGLLLGLTVDREQDVRGWHPHRIGGYSNDGATAYAVVESVITIPSPAADRDELWMIVRRRVNGATFRSVEWMEYHHEEGDDPEDAFYVDCGLTFNNTKNAILTPGAGATVKGTTNVIFNSSALLTWAAGDVGKRIHYRYSIKTVPIGKTVWKRGVAVITQFVTDQQVKATITSPWPDLTPIAANGWRMTATSITGLNHLIGQTVQVWTGASHTDCVVDVTGKITLQYPVSKAQIGLGCPAVLQPMPIEAGAADGTAKGKKQRVSRAALFFHETLGAKYGKDEDEQLDRVVFRSGSDPMDEPPPLFTGAKKVAWPDGYDDEVGALITIVQDEPGPCTVTCIAPQITTQDGA